MSEFPTIKSTKNVLFKKISEIPVFPDFGKTPITDHPQPPRLPHKPTALWTAPCYHSDQPGHGPACRPQPARPPGILVGPLRCAGKGRGFCRFAWIRLFCPCNPPTPSPRAAIMNKIHRECIVLIISKSCACEFYSFFNDGPLRCNFFSSLLVWVGRVGSHKKAPVRAGQ